VKASQMQGGFGRQIDGVNGSGDSRQNGNGE